mgnify:CR=1 FL=1
MPRRSAIPVRLGVTRTPTNAEEMEAMRRRAWHEQGVVSLRPEEINDAWERQVVINLAEARWGKRA